MNDVSDRVNDDTVRLVAELRARRAETTCIEVKKAERKVPNSLLDTLSAFSNDAGGVVLLGIDESDDFRTVDGFDAAAVRDGAVSALAKLTPHGTAPVEIEEFEGGHLVRIDVAELPSVEKPCFISSQGQYRGSFTRTGAGEGDRHLTEYEVSQLLLNRGQPTFDEEPVTAATPDDLDAEAVRRYCADRRRDQPGPFRDVDDPTLMTMTNVLTRVDDRLVPTLGGLLTLGKYPQQFFPQLSLSVVVLPATSLDEIPEGSPRFLDNRSCDGSIPEMVAAARDVLRRNMSKSSTIRGLGRKDRYDYPDAAIRELLVNALLHRDYSPGSRGTPVQVELYPDRLEIRNPGGFYGNVDSSALGLAGVSSSRNASLSRLLCEVPLPGTNDPVAEDRGSGILTVLGALRRAGMSPPRFDSNLLRTLVTVPGHALLSPTTVAWMDSIGLSDLDDQARIVVAIARTSGTVTNAELQAWGIHATDATRILHGLVDRGVLRRTGGRRYASYLLVPDLSAVDSPQLELGWNADDHQPTTDRRTDTTTSRRGSILDFVREHGPVTTKQVEAEFGVSYAVALGDLNALLDAGEITATAPKRSKNRAYVAKGR